MKENRSKENYLKAIYILSKKEPVRSYHIADKIGFSRPSVCNALKELEKDGLVHTKEDHIIRLTEKGYQLAKETYDRNQLVEMFLMHLGVDEAIAKQDACEVEHLLSKETYWALKKWSESKLA